MINEEIISKRYADAFLGYADQTLGLDKALDELQRAKRILHDNPDLKEFFDHLEITSSEKIEVVEAIFKDDFSDELRNLFRLLIDKKRIYLFVDIAEYARIHYAHGTEVDTLLKTSYPLDDGMVQRIKDAIEARIKKKIHLYVQLDAELVGGAYAQIGNIIIDGSVKRRLADMKDKLITVEVG